MRVKLVAMNTTPRRLSFVVGTSLLALSMSVGCTEKPKDSPGSDKKPEGVKTVNEGPQPDIVNEGPEPEPPVKMVNPGPEEDVAPPPEPKTEPRAMPGVDHSPSK